ncbi:MAG: hypothetical protein KAH84_01715 [Thiomargarita sp.]|nr:hypothetical protein [Thiomargarita sp.]
MKTHYKLYLNAILLSCSLNSYANQISPAGITDDFNGALADYSIQRGNQTIPMAIYVPVYAGDIIDISENHFLDIQQYNEIHKITHNDSPYTVQAKKCNTIGVNG